MMEREKFVNTWLEISDSAVIVYLYWAVIIKSSPYLSNRKMVAMTEKSIRECVCSSRRTVFSLFLLPLVFLFLLPTLTASGAPRYLRANQQGYLPSDTKVAIAFSNDDISALNFRVIDATTGETAFGPMSVGADTGSYCAFAHNHRLDFTAFTRTGSFKVSLAEGSAESYYFTISPGVYQGTQEEILHYLRSQRCGYNPFLEATCHTYPESATDGDAWKVDDSAFADMSGGWHDAGDYIKFLLTVRSPILPASIFTAPASRARWGVWPGIAIIFR